MTIDLEPIPSHKKAKKRKDRTAEVNGDREDASDEREERKKSGRRKERMEGGLLSMVHSHFSLSPRILADTDAIRYHYR